MHQIIRPEALEKLPSLLRSGAHAEIRKKKIAPELDPIAQAPKNARVTMVYSGIALLYDQTCLDILRNSGIQRCSLSRHRDMTYTPEY